jgi:hypothetical protein
MKYLSRDGRRLEMTTTDESKRVSRDEFIYRAFLVFGICGITSALLDLDHSWKYFGFEEPFNFTGRYGRPLHSPLVLLLVSFVLSIILVSLGYGRNLAIPLWLREPPEDDEEQQADGPSQEMSN